MTQSTSPSGSSSNPDIERNLANERTPLIKHDGNGNNTQSDQQSALRQTSSDSQEDEIAITAQELPFGKLAIIFSTAWVGVFLGAVDSTVIATLTAPISSEFKCLNLLSWLATAYLISNAVCQPISGRLTDIFGRGPGLIFSNILFSAGNLICGFASNEYQLILGRAIAGIGGGGLMSIATFLGSDLIPLRKRGVVQGILNLCFGSGAMLGGVIGGLINDHTKLGWRLAFIIQAPPSLLAAVGVYFFIRIPPKQSQKSYLARIDFLGVFLLTSFLVLLLLGLNAGGNVVLWTHPLPLTTIPLSVIAFILFIWWESRAIQPIIPVKLLLKRTVLAACLSNFFCTMVMFAVMFYVPLYLQVRGRTSTEVGLLILFAPLGSCFSSIGAGIIMNKTGRYTRLGVACLIVMTSGVIILGFHNENTPYWLTASVFLLVGTGYASMLTTTLLACIAAVEHAHQAVVTSATYLGRSVGSTLGITISSAVYQNVLNDKLWDRFRDYPDAGREIARIRNNIAELRHLPEGWYEGVIESFMDAFHAVFITLLGMAVIGLVCITFMKQHTLHSTLERDRR
ncbi:major facilitator superfamily domain-containing protein [Nemania serpens]|nr:major facilitator superfamily domain-containing protein [Nemania serpens]